MAFDYERNMFAQHLEMSGIRAKLEIPNEEDRRELAK